MTEMSIQINIKEEFMTNYYYMWMYSALAFWKCLPNYTVWRVQNVFVFVSMKKKKEMDRKRDLK